MEGLRQDLDVRPIPLTERLSGFFNVLADVFRSAPRQRPGEPAAVPVSFEDECTCPGLCNRDHENE